MVNLPLVICLVVLGRIQQLGDTSGRIEYALWAGFAFLECRQVIRG